MSTAPALQPALELVGSPEEVRRRELAAFLRSRRERIAPEQVGLPNLGRRRTPGLRREEVAQLAAVGVTWYTWLEQGRDISVSVQVLDAIARALLLDAGERTHLFSLAGSADPAPPLSCPTITPTVRTIIDQLSPLPAVALNARFDILAYNRTYRLLVDDLDAVPAEERNIMWLAFTRPAWRRALPDWNDAARTMVAKFRAAMADHMSEPAWKAQLKRLQLASPEFAGLWQQHDVTVSSEGQKRFLNPRVGLLHFEYTNLWLAPRQSTRLISYIPADEETRARLAELDRLAAEPV